MNTSPNSVCTVTTSLNHTAGLYASTGFCSINTSFHYTSVTAWNLIITCACIHVHVLFHSNEFAIYVKIHCMRNQYKLLLE